MSNPSFEFVKQLGKELAKNDFDLPPFPDTALRVQEALSDPDVSIDKLTGIVLSEPALAELAELHGVGDMPSLSRMKIDAEGLLEILRETDEEVRSMTQAMSG